MSLETILKSLIRQANTTGDMKLTQIARKVDVPYNRIWRLMDDSYPDILSIEDAQKIARKLAGKSIILEIQSDAQ